MTGEARPRKAPRRFRFSLRTLLLASLLAGSAMLLHSQWAPWTECTFVPPDAIGPCYAEFSSDGTRLLTVHSNRLIRLWDARGLTEQVRLDIPEHVWLDFFYTGARLSPDGRWIVVLPSVWDADTGKPQGTLFATSRVQAAAFAPDGSWFLTGSPESAESGGYGANLWDLRTRDEVLTVAKEEHVNQVCFSPCGRWFLTVAAFWVVKPAAAKVQAYEEPVTEEGVARIWNTATGRETVTLHGVHPWAWGAAFFPDGSKLATVDGSQLRILDASNGEVLTQTEATRQEQVFVSPDARRIVTTEKWPRAGSNCQLRDARSLAIIGTLQRRNAGNLMLWSPPGVEGLAFAPDGQRIILESDTSVWFAEDGTELWNLGRPLIGVNPHSFDPEGRRIVSGDENGAVHIWSRRRPERWWGVVCLPAFWVTMLVGGALVWSFRRDRKTL